MSTTSVQALNRFAAALSNNRKLWKAQRTFRVDGVDIGVSSYDTASAPLGLPTPSLNRREYVVTWQAQGQQHCRKIIRFDNDNRRYIIDQTWPVLWYPTLTKAISRCLLNDFTVCT